MMGMSMVMSPILIPQQNGPPMIINVPSYVYPPNMLPSTGSTTSTSTANNNAVASASNLLSVSVQSRPFVVETAAAATASGPPTPSQQQPSNHPPPVTVVSNHIRDLEHDTNANQIEATNNAVATNIVSISPIPSTAPTTGTTVATAPPASSSSLDPVIENNNSNNLKSFPSSSSSSRFTDTLQDIEPRALNQNETENVLTVKTVSDLRSAQMLLKSNDDIQIVVANELLETAEFKDFMSHLNLPQQMQHQDANHVPPNTPIATRPSSTVPMKMDGDDLRDSASSPLPSTSRTMSHESSPKALNHEHDADEGDADNISLQDLVAMETMEQADDDEDDDDDIANEENSDDEAEEPGVDEKDLDNNADDDEYLFRMASVNVNTPLEPIVNAILRDRTESYECDFCGLHFPTNEDYLVHKTDICSRRKTSKNGGNKVKKSVLIHPNALTASMTTTSGNSSSAVMFEGLAEVKSEVNSVLSASDLQPSSSSHYNHFKFEREIKDVLEQPALGALDGDDKNGHWKCHECLIVFTSAQDLHRHQEEFKLAKFKCRPCHVIYDDRKSLLAHRRDYHNLPNDNLVTRIKTEKAEDLSTFLVPNESGDLTCRKCDRIFQDKELAIKHMSCHEEEKSFECLECGKKFARAALLRDHRKRHFSEGTNECHYCFKKFLSPNKLREHIRVHTGEAPLLCNICGKGFKRHSNLSEHKRIHDENRPVKPPKELYCHCGKVFKTTRALDWHVEEVHERVPKKCNFCGEVFVHSTSLTRHIRLKHENNFVPDNKKSSLSAKCPICLQMFYKTSINKHIRIKHQGLKPYTCDICKMGFVTKNNLENHQYQHKGLRSRPFKCQMCRKAYVRQSQLDAHIRSHKGLKPFVCNECGLQFTNKSNWQRHVSEHSGVRNFKCPDCGKRFSRSYYLTDHMKTHSGEKPYSCAICGKTAATRSNYNSHLRTHITREPVNSEV